MSIEILQLRQQLEAFREHGRTEAFNKPTKQFDHLLTKDQRKRMAKRVAELEAQRKQWHKVYTVRSNANNPTHFYIDKVKRLKELLERWVNSDPADPNYAAYLQQIYRQSLLAANYFFEKVPKEQRALFRLHPECASRKYKPPKTIFDAIAVLPAYDEEAALEAYRVCSEPSKLAAIEMLEEVIAAKERDLAAAQVPPEHAELRYLLTSASHPHGRLRE
ncbi:hypothetical protein JYK14_01175 [Siccirubricoccus sp. KC 17139]|uniref:Uncharacterized protein n=1 Tax=Siccirubricoccus soli TaxID=2899147 RepID=A0ABT1CYR0_9PROT|nr:hypothetical protein [Siccirubricoccus soli]MCO6414792.1 hypothetical protein [Siccirubricoccus soli]MCP2680922.1 hypothetical protein [Siccirubricoccus soli]